MKMVIDWSVISHINWHKMFSANYIATGDEIREWSRNVAKHIIYLTTRFEADEVVFALDAPSNWRSDYTKNWYMENTDWYMDNTNPKHWFVEVDKVLWEVTHSEISDSWTRKKVATKERQVIELDNDQLFTRYAKGHTPESILELYPDAPKHISLMTSWDGLKEVIPFYKGTRSSAKWPAHTPKSEFKKMIPELAAQIAPLIGGKAVMAPFAEGDDVIATVVNKWTNDSPDEEIILVTVDADLRQLFISSPNLTIFDLTGTPKLINESVDVAYYHLICKILGGDSSDNIKGVSFEKRAAALPTVSFEAETGNVKSGKGTDNWIRKITDPLERKGKTGADLWGPVFRAAQKESVLPTFHRNMTLVYLANLPESITHEILEYWEKTDVEETDLTWDTFGVTAVEMQNTRHQAVFDMEAAQNG